MCGITKLYITANGFHHLTGARLFTNASSWGRYSLHSILSWINRIIWIHKDAIWIVEFMIQFLLPDGGMFRGPAVCHLDDICIFIANVNEMLGQIEMVFKRLKDFNFEIKPKKCHFFKCSLVFLGYDLSADNISTNPEKVEKLQHWPVPSNQKELHSFLGLAFYYKHLIPMFAVISKCLCEMVGPTHIKTGNQGRDNQNSDFKWIDEHQKVFNLLKAWLTNRVVLGYPDFSHHFDLETDASLQGLEAVLSQMEKYTQSKVIAYVSWSLCSNKKKMRNYSLAKLELLALKWAMMEKLQE